MKCNHILQGEEIEILNLNLTNKNNKLIMVWEIKVASTIRTVTFYNVSMLRICELSAPFIIYGFEIVDRSLSGWQSDTTYEIRDFENGTINFYCEKIVM